MTEQKEFEWSPREHHRRDNLPTSSAAAHSIARDAPSLMLALLVCLKRYGPQTFSELSQRTGIAGWQVTKRVSDLKNKNLVRPSSVTRTGASGRQQTVWEAT